MILCLGDAKKRAVDFVRQNHTEEHAEKAKILVKLLPANMEPVVMQKHVSINPTCSRFNLKLLLFFLSNGSYCIVNPCSDLT